MGSSPPDLARADRTPSPTAAVEKCQKLEQFLGMDRTILVDLQIGIAMLAPLLASAASLHDGLADQDIPYLNQQVRVDGFHLKVQTSRLSVPPKRWIASRSLAVLPRRELCIERRLDL
jgi:hypothetical protein